MSFNDVSLTAGMRSNLISLQGTVDLLNRTQTRLSTGKKVNSALDNPTSYFAAQGLNQRASDLAGLKDGMGQAIQTVSAANAGITGIATLIEAAKGIAQAALGTADTTSRSNYAAQFDAIRGQIDTLATDAGYKGTNLLGSATASLSVSFNEDNSSTLAINGLDASSTGLGVVASTTNWSTDVAIGTSVGLLNAATSTLRDAASSLSSNLAVVNARQDFTTQMVNTLTQGSDKLTLADMNEEGANMLMLQTRQSLGTSALSMSAQAAQSVLKLFQ
jgi:flagellin